jgi:phospholipid transport system substrate-binding protein
MSKNKMKVLFQFLLFFFSFIFFPQAAVHAGEPTNLVKQTIDQARDIFNDPKLNEDERIGKLRSIANERFDFEEMSRRALAGKWRTLSEARKKEFVSLFSGLIKDSYSNKIKRYQKEIKEHSMDRVLFLDERIEGPYATVKTNIITFSGIAVPVDYRFIRKEGKWLAYDVIVEGVSLVRNYRSQFSEILRSSSYEELVGRIREKRLREKQK